MIGAATGYVGYRGMRSVRRSSSGEARGRWSWPARTPLVSAKVGLPAAQRLPVRHPGTGVLQELSEAGMSVPEALITTSPDRLSGTPVFAGTRVPVQTLIDYLEAGDPLEAFLSDFPSVSREHAVAVLELAKFALLAKAVAA